MSAIWAKFNKNEKNVSFGAAIVLVAWVVGLVGSYGFGFGLLSALGAIIVLAIYYLKYAPNTNIQWPAPIPVIVLAISAIIAIGAVLSLVQILGILSFAGFLGIYFIALLATTAGAVLMAFAAWNEYKATEGERAAAAPPAAAAPARSRAARHRRPHRRSRRHRPLRPQRRRRDEGASARLSPFRVSREPGGADRPVPRFRDPQPAPVTGSAAPSVRASSRASEPLLAPLRKPNPQTTAPPKRRPAETSDARWNASIEAIWAASATSGGVPAFGGLRGTTSARSVGSDGSSPGTCLAMLA